MYFVHNCLQFLQLYSFTCTTYKPSHRSHTIIPLSNHHTIIILKSHNLRNIYLMQKRATCVGRRSKCLRFQPSKSSSSSPLEAYYRTFTERGKNLKRMNLFHSSRAAASRRSFLFFGPSSSFFRCWSVHPYQKKQSTTTQKAENDISNQQKERIRSRSFSRWAPVSENA